VSTSRGATVAQWWPWLVLPAAASSLVAVGLTLALVDPGEPWLRGEAWVNMPLAVGFSTVAAGIWSSGPDRPGLWRLAVLYTVVGVASALVLPAFGWVRLDLPGAGLAAWVSNWVWTLGAPPLLGLGLVLYPDGRLPGRRWWPVAVLGTLGPLALLSSMAFAPGGLGNHPHVTNPAGVPVPGWEVVGTVGFASLMAAAALGLAGLAVKYRNAGAGSDVRGQVAGVAIAGTAVVLVAGTEADEAGLAGAVLSFAVGALLPLTVGVAVVRQRLLDQRSGVEDLYRRVDTLTVSRRELVTEREDERARLRRELHDGLGPSLAAIGLGLRHLQHHGRAEQDTVQALADEAHRAVAEVRRLCDGLRPAALQELGLARALAEGLRSLGRVGPDMDVGIEELPPLPPAVEVAAYRIVMEAATNAVRHARATTVRVRVACHGGLVMSVADDGSGIVPEARRGIGLDGMAERAEEIGGTLSLTTAAGRGTTVEARLPAVVRE
jgi:signal transduction histidine kinase